MGMEAATATVNIETTVDTRRRMVERRSRLVVVRTRMNRLAWADVLGRRQSFRLRYPRSLDDEDDDHHHEGRIGRL